MIKPIREIKYFGTFAVWQTHPRSRMILLTFLLCGIRTLYKQYSVWMWMVCGTDFTLCSILKGFCNMEYGFKKVYRTDMLRSFLSFMLKKYKLLLWFIIILCPFIGHDRFLGHFSQLTDCKNIVTGDRRYIQFSLDHPVWGLSLNVR